jgi:hypothetical protein
MVWGSNLRLVPLPMWPRGAVAKQWAHSKALHRDAAGIGYLRVSGIMSDVSGIRSQAKYTYDCFSLPPAYALHSRPNTHKPREHPLPVPVFEPSSTGLNGRHMTTIT